MNQIDKWLELGYLSAVPQQRPQAAIWDDQDASLGCPRAGLFGYKLRALS